MLAEVYRHDRDSCHVPCHDTAYRNNATSGR
jgi:hypothetical protein